MDFYVHISAKKMNYADTLYYHWFKSQKIHQTQGRSAGYVLHGNFLKHYVDGQLAEQGEFKYGLKNGQWTTWYNSGKIESKRVYKKGILQGDYALFDEDGKLIEGGRYKNGKKKLPKIKQEKGEEETEADEDKKPWFKRIVGIFKNESNSDKTSEDAGIEEEEDPEKIAKKLEKIKRKEEKKKAREEAKKGKN